MTDEAALNTIAHLERALAHSEQERERDRQWVKSCMAAGLAATRKRMDAEGHLERVEARLASAQQELDAMRTVRDRVLADMAEQNAIILSQLCLRCGIELDAQLAAENTNPSTTSQGEPS